MVKTEYQFEDFLANVSDECKDFVKQVHEMLSQDNYTVKIEQKASGFFVSYLQPKNKRSILNFLFRKKGLLIGIYGDNCNKYAELLDKLPENMVKQIDKGGVCKRLIDPTTCNSRCVMGYDFYVSDKHYQKCRNSCFYFGVDLEGIPLLIDIIKSESEERLAL